MSANESAEQVRWDLSDLIDGDGAGEEGVEALLDTALKRAGEFAARYRGALETIDGEGLAAAMLALAEIYDLLGRADSYAALDFSTDTTDPARGALVARVQERSTTVATTLMWVQSVLSDCPASTRLTARNPTEMTATHAARPIAPDEPN